MSIYLIDLRSFFNSSLLVIKKSTFQCRDFPQFYLTSTNILTHLLVVAERVHVDPDEELLVWCELSQDESGVAVVV